MSGNGTAARLACGLDRLGIDLSPGRQEQLLAYLRLLARWNRAYNLTAVDDPAVMVDRHLLDSLSILPWLRGKRIMDAGTGAGLPGVPLAVACADRHFILVDSNGKKIRFLRQVRRELELDNIEPLQARVEALELESAPDEIVVRALAPLPRLIDQLGGFLDAGARLLAMKGRLEQSECSGVPEAYNVERIKLEVPGASGARCLVIVEKA